MLSRQFTPHRQHVHDREDAGAAEVDALALEVRWLADAVAPHVDGGVAEGARQEHRDGHIGTVALRHLERVAGERQLAHVEFAAAEGAEEGLLGRQQHEDGIHAVDLDRAVLQRAGTVILAHGDRKSQLVQCKSLLAGDSAEGGVANPSGEPLRRWDAARAPAPQEGFDLHWSGGDSSEAATRQGVPWAFRIAMVMAHWLQPAPDAANEVLLRRPRFNQQTSTYHRYP